MRFSGGVGGALGRVVLAIGRVVVVVVPLLLEAVVFDGTVTEVVFDGTVTFEVKDVVVVWLVRLGALAAADAYTLRSGLLPVERLTIWPLATETPAPETLCEGV